MTTWHILAQENRTAASILFRDDKFRSMVSRAYYAVYAKATQALIAVPVQMPETREGPSHKKLRPLIETNLRTLDKPERQAVSRIVGELYAMRLCADYQPSAEVGKKEGRQALALMKKAFDLLS